ncbi:MAG: choice-of-anchor J domain-containing protein [Ignavibacteria bacterium]|nr:choice-of-anchor J domain-containing protein [Ignavibacteria bacterium]
MKKKLLVYSTFLFLIIGVMLGFTSINDNPNKDKSQVSSKTKTTKTIDVKKLNSFESDNNGGVYQTDGLPYYTDNFDGANDTVALKSRGYLVYYRGGGPQSVFTWFQGNSTVFVAFNGPATGYVAANYQVVSGTNNIDSWLVLPKKSVAAADSIVFYSRSPTASTFPDSIRVMYSAAGDSIPEAAWTELGRFKANVAGVWERKAFGAPVAGANARYAIRYNVVNGGPSGANSDFIGIDALTLETTPVANDVATTSIDSVFNYALPVDVIAPRATFSNNGTANQTNIPVTYKVTGPVNYTNNKVIASLNSGASAQVVFDSTFYPNLPGTYNITVYCSLASDQFRGNDTLRTSFFVVQPNYGGGGPGSGGYYFANSTPGASLAPSQPSFCWVDTAGSTTLVSNSVAAVPLDSGSLDDGRWTLTGVTGLKRIKFMGTLYSDVYVGTNGIISFVPFTAGNGNWYPPSTGLPGPGAGAPVRPAIYPAWNDLNWGNALQPINRLSYKIDAAKNRLIVTYDRAPIFGGDATEWETFQVCIDLVDNNVGSSNSNFTISHSNTTTVLQTNYLVGMQDATGANFLQYLYINGSGQFLAVGPLFDTTANGGVSIAFGPDPTLLNGPCEKILGLTMNFEVCNSPSQVFVLLRNATSPYAIVDSVVGTAGIDLQYPIYFDNAGNGVPYYVVVRSVNAVETWSSSTVTFNGGSTTYDFTTALNKAYGSNQILNIGGVPSLYQGDTDQDGNVSLTDVLNVYGVLQIFGSTPATNLDCTGGTDLSDLIVAFNNSKNFIITQRP